MHHFLLFYEFGPTYEAQRGTFRPQHLKQAWAASDRGELVLAGALIRPLDTGVLLFKGETPAAAEEFARTDPYVVNGLVTRWWAREWMTAVGKDAASPIGAGQLQS